MIKDLFLGAFLLSHSLNAYVSVAIGSTNPTKIQAVKNVFTEQTVVPCSVSSNVRPQPLSDEETLRGALNRANNCLKVTDADLAIGLEAGVVLLNDQVFLCHWGAITNRQNKSYFTCGPLILLPSEYKKTLEDGETLEDIMHRTTGIQNLGSKGGAIGIFTQNRLNREQVLTQMVQALIGQHDYYAQPQPVHNGHEYHQYEHNKPSLDEHGQDWEY